MLWKKISPCLLTFKCCKHKNEEVESLVVSEEPAGHESRSVTESDSLYGDVSLNLEDQRDDYYYYTETPQMEECAMKWLRQYKSEVSALSLWLIGYFFTPFLLHVEICREFCLAWLHQQALHC